MLARILTVAAGLSICFTLTAQSFISSNLPIIIINTQGVEIPDDPKIGADMGIIYNGPGLRNSLTDPYNNYNGKAGIELRGKSSQSFPMKSYSIELRDAGGNSLDKSLLGMPKESDWVLYAPYTDKTLMRNFLAYTMSRELGNYASRCQYVELMINNDYKGIYILEEKIKRGSGRVPVAKLTSSDIAGDDVTGGYIVKLDKKDPDEESWVSAYKPNGNSARSVEFIYDYPKTSNIVQQQKDYIKRYVDSFELALASNEFQDPDKGYRRFIDMTSFIDYFIINEVSRNVDGYRLSSYFNKDKDSKGGKLKAGPVWDYDIAFRNADYCSGSNLTGWSYQFNTVCRDDSWLVPFWWDRFMLDSAFTSTLRCRWKDARLHSLSNQRIMTLIDSVSTLLNEAQQRHFQRWPVLGQYIWPNPQPIPTTYAGEISALKNWISQRLSWIDNNIPNTGGCYDWPIGQPGTLRATIYPNPVVSGLAVEVVSKNDQKMQVRITNMMGQLVYQSRLDVRAGIHPISLNIPVIPGGVYFASFRAESGEEITSRFVKQ